MIYCHVRVCCVYKPMSSTVRTINSTKPFTKHRAVRSESSLFISKNREQKWKVGE
ncbi:hypothetical protein LINPERHAP1_LOCUS17554 [Linum perenne]